jgi:hypothetical protein
MQSSLRAVRMKSVKVTWPQHHVATECQSPVQCIPATCFPQSQRAQTNPSGDDIPQQKVVRPMPEPNLHALVPTRSHTLSHQDIGIHDAGCQLTKQRNATLDVRKVSFCIRSVADC